MRQLFLWVLVGACHWVPEPRQDDGAHPGTSDTDLPADTDRYDTAPPDSGRTDTATVFPPHTGDSSAPDTFVPCDTSTPGCGGGGGQDTDTSGGDTSDTDPPPADTGQVWPDTADSATVVDTGACPAPKAPACAAGETQVCGGACVPGFLATPPSAPGHDGRADCLTFTASPLVPRRATPGYVGLPTSRPFADPGALELLRNCWGEAESNPRGFGDGRCDERWNCDLLEWDGGDCAVQVSVVGKNAVVSTTAQVAALAGVTELDSLEITGRTLTSVTLPDLIRVRHLQVRATALTHLSFPALQAVEGRVQIATARRLESLSAPVLTTIGGDWWTTPFQQGEAVHLENLPALRTLTLDRLAHVGAGFRLTGATGLRELRLPALVQVMGGLYLQDMGALRAVGLPRLRDVGHHLKLDGLDTLTQVELPDLRTVGSTLELRRMPMLTTFAAPRLRRTGTLRLNESYDLVSAALPSLEWVAGPMRLSSEGVDLRRLRHVGAPLVLNLGGTEPLDLCALEEATDVRLSLGEFVPSVSLPVWSGEVDRFEVATWSAAGVPAIDVDAPQVTAVHALSLRTAGVVHLDALQRVDGDLTVAYVSTFDAPALTAVDALCVSSWRSPISFPAIRTARAVVASGNVALSLSALESVDWLYVYGFGDLSVPNLKSIGPGQTRDDCGFRIGGYHRASANRIDATTLDARALTHADQLNISAISDLTLPELRTSGELVLGTNGAVDAPQLSTVRDLYVSRASAVRLPALDEVDVLTLDLSSTVLTPVVELPLLTRLQDLTIRTYGRGVLRLPALQRIEGTLTSTAIDTLALPGLTHLHQGLIGAIPHLDLSALVEADELRIGEQFKICEDITTGGRAPWSTPMDLALDALTTVGTLDVMHTEGPTRLSFPRLAVIRDRMRLIDLPYVTHVDLPGIVDIPDDTWINFRNTTALTTVDLSRARAVGRLAFWNTAMTSIAFPNLTTFHDRISVRENRALTSIRYVGVTTAGGVDVGDNPVLQTFDLPLLTHVTGDVTIDFNVQLPTCDVEAMVQRWVVDGTTDIHANEACLP